MLNIKNIQHVLTDHCNLRCNNCSTLSPLIPKHYSDLEQFKKDIEKLSSIIHTKTFELVGGEPLLNKKIDDFLQVLVDYKITDSITIFTNGKFLPKMSDKFYSLIDGINISTYPYSKINYKKIKLFLEEKQKSIDFSFNFSLKKEFMVIHKPQELDTNITKTIFEDCKIAHEWNCALIKDGYYYKCNIPYFKNKHSGFDNKQDGIDIHSTEFPMNFYRYLKNKEPLEACKECDGTSGKMVPHSQIIKLVFK